MTTNYIDQTIFHSENMLGNCFQACLATILGKNLESVPHFVVLGATHWMACAVAWLDCEHGLIINTSQDTDLGEVLPMHLINGMSPRGVRHSVVADTLTGEMVHDPHPSREGITFINSRFFFHRIKRPNTETVEAMQEARQMRRNNPKDDTRTVTDDRLSNVTYTNTHGRPLRVAVAGKDLRFWIGGFLLAQNVNVTDFIVPTSATYRSTFVSLDSWTESTTRLE